MDGTSYQFLSYDDRLVDGLVIINIKEWMADYLKTLGVKAYIKGV